MNSDEYEYGGGSGAGNYGEDDEEDPMMMEEEEEEQYGDDDDEEITQEDAWAVISAYFEERGLVGQQLDSFDEFIQNTRQEIVDESADIEISPESQHNPGHPSEFAEVGEVESCGIWGLNWL
ncbi:DNA-directed RNA polymerase II subunit RPB2-like protein [Drosera capensis]